MNKAILFTMALKNKILESKFTQSDEWFYTEKHSSLIKEIKEEENKLKGVPCSWKEKSMLWKCI